MKANWLALVVVLVAVLLVAAPFAAAKSSGPNEGRLEAMDPNGKALGTCPLKHTDVTVDIPGFIARVTVRQQFHNPSRTRSRRSTSSRSRRTRPWTG